MSSTAGPIRQPVAALVALPALLVAAAAGTRPVGVLDAFRNVAGEPTLLLTVLLVVAAPLLAQDRIGRRNPTLASAPVEAEPELVRGPVHRTPSDDPGGASA